MTQTRMTIDIINDDRKTKNFNLKHWLKISPEIEVEKLITVGFKLSALLRLKKYKIAKKTTGIRVTILGVHYGLVLVEGGKKYYLCSPDEVEYFMNIGESEGLLQYFFENREKIWVGWLTKTNVTGLKTFLGNPEKEFYRQFFDENRMIADIPEFSFSTNGPNKHKITTGTIRYTKDLPELNNLQFLILYIFFQYGPKKYDKIWRKSRYFALEDKAFTIKCKGCGKHTIYENHHYIVDNRHSDKKTEKNGKKQEPSKIVNQTNFFLPENSLKLVDVCFRTIPNCPNCHKDYHGKGKYLIRKDYDKRLMGVKYGTALPWGILSKKNYDLFFKNFPDLKKVKTYEVFISEIENKEKEIFTKWEEERKVKKGIYDTRKAMMSHLKLPNGSR